MRDIFQLTTETSVQSAIWRIVKPALTITAKAIFETMPFVGIRGLFERAGFERAGGADRC